MKKRRKLKKPKVNKKIAVRQMIVDSGAYDGRFREKRVELKKHKKIKHKKKLIEND